MAYSTNISVTNKQLDYDCLKEFMDCIYGGETSSWRNICAAIVPGAMGVTSIILSSLCDPSNPNGNDTPREGALALAGIGLGFSFLNTICNCFYKSRYDEEICKDVELRPIVRQRRWATDSSTCIAIISIGINVAGVIMPIFMCKDE